MKLFDFLKKIRNSGLGYPEPKPISNDEYQRKREEESNRLECKYDLSTVSGINDIPVPKRKEPSCGALPNVTGRIEYYLMLKASEYEKAEKVELALACFRKANQLMPMSPISYQHESYMRLPRYLRKLRRFDEAKAEEAKIKPLFPDGGIFELSKSEFMKDMNTFGHSSLRAEELYRDYKVERDKERKKEIYRADYDWLWEFMPELCPKSFSGYMRMKNAKTEKFQKIVMEAKKSGRNIK